MKYFKPFVGFFEALVINNSVSNRRLSVLPEL